MFMEASLWTRIGHHATPLGKQGSEPGIIALIQDAPTLKAAFAPGARAKNVTRRYDGGPSPTLC
jgi:hypothetical protein